MITAAEPATVHATVCRMCHGGCGALVTVAADRVLEITGDRDNPNNDGFLCAKGRASIEHAYHPDRLHTPLMRNRAGELVTASWDGALDEVASRLAQYRRDSGPESVVLAQGTDRNYQEWLFRFANAFGSPNVLGPAHVCFYPRVMAGIMTLGGFTFCDYENSPEVIVVWGSNKSATHGDGVIGTRLLGAVSRGSRLIVIDPRRTQLAARAEHWLQLRPGTDAALGLGLLHVIIAEGLIDEEFIERHTMGYADLVKHVRNRTPAWAAEICGVPADDIVAAARAYARAASAAIELGTGTAQHKNSFSTARIAVLLAALTGNIDRPGGDVLWGPSGIVGRRTMPMQEALEPAQHDKRLGGRQHKILSMSGWAEPAAVWRAALHSDPYRVRAMAVFGSNLLVAYPDADRVHQALRALDFLVVSDLFLTPTAALADVVLPASGWLERNQIVEHANYVAARRRFTEVGQARSDEQILLELAARLELDGFWSTVEESLDARLSPLAMTWNELVETYYRPTELRHYKYRTEGFQTRSGRVALSHPGLAQMGYPPLPIYEPTTPGPGELVLTSRHSPFYFNSEFRQVASLRRKEPYPTAELHPETATEHQVVDGSWVLLEANGRQGLFRANVSDRLAPGVVCASASWWYPELPPDRSWRISNVNRLLADGDASAEMGSANLRGVGCRLSTAPAELVAAVLRTDLAEWADEIA